MDGCYWTGSSGFGESQLPPPFPYGVTKLFAVAVVNHCWPLSSVSWPIEIVDAKRRGNVDLVVDISSSFHIQRHNHVLALEVTGSIKGFYTDDC
uniref:Uncharacterized protein n=1 Tax=Vespula pensylvanica TaxID=30213 RepID=A0A834KCE9_VESPE|nr:hypothetical protein H0235_014852 [Vespula pensylvanica]